MNKRMINKAAQMYGYIQLSNRIGLAKGGKLHKEDKEDFHLYNTLHIEEAYKAGAQRAMDQLWVSVDDALPDEDTPVLIFCEYGAEIGSYDGNQWEINGYGRVDSVTHWMAFPPLPIARKGNRK